MSIRPPSSKTARGVVGFFHQDLVFLSCRAGGGHRRKLQLQLGFVAFERNAIVGNACRLGNSVSIFSHVELEGFLFSARPTWFLHIFPFRGRRSMDMPSSGRPSSGPERPLVRIRPWSRMSRAALALSWRPGTVPLTKDSKDWSMMVGTPARQVGWVSAFGEKIGLPLSGTGEWRCKHTGDVYVLNGSVLIRHPGPRDILKYVAGERLERVGILLRTDARFRGQAAFRLKGLMNSDSRLRGRPCSFGCAAS